MNIELDEKSKERLKWMSEKMNMSKSEFIAHMLYQFEKNPPYELQ
jgi:hypothetical protein